MRPRMTYDDGTDAGPRAASNPRRVAYPLLAVMGIGAVACGGRGRTGTSADTTAVAPPVAVNWTAVDSALGLGGVPEAGGVHRYSMPRTDLDVVLNGVHLDPGLGLGSWLALQPTPHGVIALGDLVLRDTEVNDVLSRLLQGGVDPTALHDYLMFESPPVRFLHFRASGDPVRIARAVRSALNMTSTPLPGMPSDRAAPARVSAPGLDTAAIHRALGFAGRLSGAVYRISIPPGFPVRDGGVALSPAMGISSSIGFQPLPDGHAAAIGDLVLRGHEVRFVVRALRNHAMTVTALHGHMLGEEPRLFFLHFWARDNAVEVARDLRDALDRMDLTPAR
jgi:Domain of Unknown Function (DUF1259)